MVWFLVPGVCAIARWFSSSLIFGASTPSLSPIAGGNPSETAALATGIALIVLWLNPPLKRGAFLVGLSGVAAIGQGLGNVFQDAFGWEWAEWGLFIGGVGLVIIVALAGILSLTVKSPMRWSRVFLLLGPPGACSAWDCSSLEGRGSGCQRLDLPARGWRDSSHRRLNRFHARSHNTTYVPLCMDQPSVDGSVAFSVWAVPGVVLGLSPLLGRTWSGRCFLWSLTPFELSGSRSLRIQHGLGHLPHNSRFSDGCRLGDFQGPWSQPRCVKRMGQTIGVIDARLSGHRHMTPID